jgi:transglutaminase-like putative cysteine protease
MNPLITRRHLLHSAAAVAAVPGLPLAALAQERRFEPRVQGWRSFEVTTTIAVADHQGTSRVWIPVPSVDAEYQRTLDHAWAGNASQARLVADPSQDARMLYAEFAPTVAQPSITLVSRVQTRDRAEDWNSPGAAKEDPAVLRRALAPSELLPLDGIVRATALKAVGNASDDLQKTRAIYRWVVSNAHREPKVRGCGTGDIKTMLETGNLGGKCADLNAVFVGLCRSVGVPARDVYGVRLAPSAFGYRELGANPASLKGAQHCRAEVFLRQHGWVAMDPADVLKVMRMETPDWIRDTAHPVVAPVAKGLFGSWEGNWLAYNTAHDVRLPGSAAKGTLPFLMYPQGENASGRFDELAPDAFKYTISAKEV